MFRPAVVHIEAPASARPRAAGQHEQGRRPDAQQRSLQLDVAARQFRIRGGITGGRDRFHVVGKRVLVTGPRPPIAGRRAGTKNDKKIL